MTSWRLREVRTDLVPMLERWQTWSDDDDRDSGRDCAKRAHVDGFGPVSGRGRPQRQELLLTLMKKPNGW